MSSNLDQLGQGHTVHGTITGTSTASISSNDGSATLTDNGTGDYTVTFGKAFLSAPTVTATPVVATFSTDAADGVSVVAVDTTSVQFNYSQPVLIGATASDTANALADGIFTFTAMGLRNI